MLELRHMSTLYKQYESWCKRFQSGHCSRQDRTINLPFLPLCLALVINLTLNHVKASMKKTSLESFNSETDNDTCSKTTHYRSISTISTGSIETYLPRNRTEYINRIDYSIKWNILNSSTSLWRASIELVALIMWIDQLKRLEMMRYWAGTTTLHYTRHVHFGQIL